MPGIAFTISTYILKKEHRNGILYTRQEAANEPNSRLMKNDSSEMLKVSGAAESPDFSELTKAEKEKST
jgi:hypothetical protein